MLLRRRLLAGRPRCPRARRRDGEPVQTDGVVPGVVAMGSFGTARAHSATTSGRGRANDGCGMRLAVLEHAREPSRCTRHHDDDCPAACSANSGTRGCDRRLQQLAHRVGGVVLARRVAEVHRGGRDVGSARLPDSVTFQPACREPVGGALGHALVRRDVEDPHVGLARRRRLPSPSVGASWCWSRWRPATPNRRHRSRRSPSPASRPTGTPRRGTAAPSPWRAGEARSGDFADSSSAHCIRAGRSLQRRRGSQVTSKPSRRAARAFCRLARSRRSRLTSIGSAASASGRSTSALSTW